MYVCIYACVCSCSPQLLAFILIVYFLRLPYGAPTTAFHETRALLSLLQIHSKLNPSNPFLPLTALLLLFPESSRLPLMLHSLPHSSILVAVLKICPLLCRVVLKFSKVILGSGKIKLVKADNWFLDKVLPKRTAPPGTNKLVIFIPDSNHRQDLKCI